MTLPPHMVSRVLPLDARERLMRAANTQYRSDQERRVAVDAAIDYVKLFWPQYFHQPKKEK